MRKRVILVSFLLTSLMISMATGSVRAQENDPEDYDELNYVMPTLDWDVLSTDAGPPIVEQLEQIGIKVLDQPMNDAIMYPKLQETPEGRDQPRPYDMYEMSWGFDAYPNHLYYQFHSDNDIDWGDNFYNLNDPEMDALLDELNAAPTVEALKQKIFEVQIKWSELLPLLPIYLNDDVHAVGSTWKGYDWDYPGGAFNAFWHWDTLLTIYAEDGDDEFVMAYPSDLRGTNPAFNNDGRSAYFLNLVYAKLFDYNSDLEPIPWLATEWSTKLEGGKTVVTFTIRDNVKWHDGMPVTAEDVAFTFLAGREADPSTLHYTFCRYVESAVVEGNTVTVTMDSARAWTMWDLANVRILPKHIWEGEDFLADRWQDPNDMEAHVGCGPFKFVSRVPEENYVLERFEDFWQPATGIKRFRMQVYATDAASLLAISAGEADTMRYNIPASYVKMAQTTEGITVYSAPDIWDYRLGFNIETPGLDDYEVRKAIAYALDREQIINRAVLGWGTAIISPVPEAFFPAWYNPATPKFTTGDQEEDIKMANQILDDAGYIDVDGDGIREFPGVTPTTTGPTTITQTIATTVVVAEFSLRAFGVFAAGMVTVILTIKRKKA